MKFTARTLKEGEHITARIEDVSAIYAEEDVVYLCGCPCVLSSVRAVRKSNKSNKKIKALRAALKGTRQVAEERGAELEMLRSVLLEVDGG